MRIVHDDSCAFIVCVHLLRTANLKEGISCFLGPILDRNSTREIDWYHFTSLMGSDKMNNVTCNNVSGYYIFKENELVSTLFILNCTSNIHIFVRYIYSSFPTICYWRNFHVRIPEKCFYQIKITPNIFTLFCIVFLYNSISENGMVCTKANNLTIRVIDYFSWSNDSRMFGRLFGHIFNAEDKKGNVNCL